MIGQVDEIKSKVDLVEVISSYVPLKKMGRNMGGLCPFHGEKTPSFKDNCRYYEITKPETIF